MTLIIYLCIGILSGLLSGLLGVGGGIIVVPALAILLKHKPLFQTSDVMHIATGTSLAVMIATSCSSALAYQRHHAIIWPLFWRMAPGLALGIGIGFQVTQHLTHTALTRLFSIFLVIVAIHLFLSAQKNKPLSTQARPPTYSVAYQALIVIASLLVGVLSVLFGIGGGILMVPLFLMLHLSMREASGTSIVCGMITAMMGTLLLSLTKSDHTYLHTSGYIYWPAAFAIAASSVCFAPLGAQLAFKLPTPVLQRLFAVVLCISAWYV